MKITTEKIKDNLIKNHGWDELDFAEISSNPYNEINPLNRVITDTIKVIDEILKQQKGISMK